MSSVRRKGTQRELINLINKYRFYWNRVILILFLLLGYSPATNAELPTTIIKSCYDGDTCTTIDGEKIRLACIDAPELRGSKAKPIPAKDAKEFLNSLITNQNVFIRRITKDKYGRTVAELIKNNINIQELMVKKDLAKVYKKYRNQCSWSKELQ